LQCEKIFAVAETWLKAYGGLEAKLNESRRIVYLHSVGRMRLALAV